MLLPVSGTFLIVDDQPVARGTLRRTLEYYGHTVLEAGDGREGLRIFNEEKRRIDLVFLSDELPDVPCEKFLFVLRRMDPDAKVILLTGRTASEVKDETTSQALAGVLRKPVNTDRLLAAVRRGMGK